MIITEPLMLARYQGEIDNRLNDVHNQQISVVEVSGAIAAYDARLQVLKKQTAAEDRAVQALNTRAAEKRRDARELYQQAIADSEGDGVSRKAGCPDGGYCDTLVKRSRGLDNQAARLDAQAARLQDTQKAARTARAVESADLTDKIAEQRTANAEAIRADAGFGARTKAMWYLVTSDFWGIASSTWASPCCWSPWTARRSGSSSSRTATPMSAGKPARRAATSTRQRSATSRASRTCAGMRRRPPG